MTSDNQSGNSGSNGSSSTREDLLILTAVRIVDLTDAWYESENQAVSEEFINAMDDLANEWRIGDIPERCRAALPTVEKIIGEWVEFEGYASVKTPAPRRAFWELVGELKNLLTFAPPKVFEGEVESIAELVAQKVSPRQIALIYSHEGKGPFIGPDGQPSVILVNREIKNPGTVIGPDFVHPRIVAERELAARYSNFFGYRAQQLRERGAAYQPESAEDVADRIAPVGPETIQDLIEQGVSDQQIALIKRVAASEVAIIRRAIESARKAADQRAIVDAVGATVEEAVASGLVSAGDTGAAGVGGTGGVGAVGGEAARVAIREYLAKNPQATTGEVAHELKVSAREIARVRNEMKELKGVAS